LKIETSILNSGQLFSLQWCCFLWIRSSSNGEISGMWRNEQ